MVEAEPAGVGGPAISVVVATRDRCERLTRLLAALAGQTLASDRFEVIVVDDASTDRTPEVLADAARSGQLAVTVLRGEGRGPARARNLGWPRAAGPVVAFTDDDCEPQPRWLEELLAAMESPESFVQGVTLPNPEESDRMGAFSRTLDVRELGPWYPTANIAFPVALLAEIGGFDEAYPAPGGEDTDLAWRAIEAGGVPRFAPDAVVWHAVSDLGPVGRLRVAWRWAPAVRVFRRHPQLRRELYLGIFWKRSHASLLLMALGCALGRRVPPALLLAVPYLRELRVRMAVERAPVACAPFYPLHDAVEIAAMVRGGARAGVPIL